MPDTSADEEFSVERATIGDGPAIFTLRIHRRLTAELQSQIGRYWEGMWKRVNSPAPPLLVLDGGMELQAFGDAELKAAGLMRIPERIE